MEPDHRLPGIQQGQSTVSEVEVDELAVIERLDGGDVARVTRREHHHVTRTDVAGTDRREGHNAIQPREGSTSETITGGLSINEVGTIKLPGTFSSGAVPESPCLRGIAHVLLPGLPDPLPAPSRRCHVGLVPPASARAAPDRTVQVAPAPDR